MQCQLPSRVTRIAVVAGVAVAVIVAAMMAASVFQESGNKPIAAPAVSSSKNDTLQQRPSIRFSQTIPLSEVKGRIDHMDVDVKHQRLFIAALGNDSVEVIDLTSGKLLHSISDLHEPQGVLFVPEYNRLFVSNGGDGAVRIFDADTFQLSHTANFSHDADNMRYDASEKIVYVGYGNGGLGMINATDDSIISTIPLDGHPESFQLSKMGGRVDKIYANIPTSHAIAIVNAHGKSAVSTLSINAGAANYPMALDVDNHALIVGLRSPPKLVVYDTITGREIAQVGITQDPDDIFIDQHGGKIFVSCGGGFVDVVMKNVEGNYVLSDHLPTASGARTSLLVPSQNRLYVAAPESTDRSAQILVFEITDLPSQ